LRHPQKFCNARVLKALTIIQNRARPLTTRFELSEVTTVADAVFRVGDALILDPGNQAKAPESTYTTALMGLLLMRRRNVYLSAAGGDGEALGVGEGEGVGDGEGVRSPMGDDSGVGGGVISGLA